MPSRTPQSITAEVDALLGPAPASYVQAEVVVLRFRRHGRRLVPPVVALLVIAGLAGYWVGALSAAWMNVLAGIGAALLGVLLGIIPVLAWLARRTTVTTRRVIVRRGLFARERSELSLGRVREVKVRRGLLQRLFGSGDVLLLHGTEQLVLGDVADCEGLADALQELVERNYEHSTRAQQRLDEASGFGVAAPGGTGVAPSQFPSAGGGGSAAADFGGAAPDSGPVRFW